MRFSAIGIAVGAALLVLALGGGALRPLHCGGRPFHTSQICGRSVTYVTAGAVTPCINQNLSRPEKREVGLWSKEDWRDG
jgi:hypothetical protein